MPQIHSRSDDLNVTETAGCCSALSARTIATDAREVDGVGRATFRPFLRL
jgi:hypothetical protein